MDIQNIISTLKTQFGDRVSESAVKNHFAGIDVSKFSISEVIDKVKNAGLIGDLDGDGVKESFFEEIKGKVSGMFGK